MGCEQPYPRAEEYRYKHQQRCLLAKQKVSKQKSCVACAASKLRCDLRIPACSRCASRNKPCQYVAPTREPQTDGQEILGSRERVQDQSAAPDVSLDIHDQDAFSGSQRHAPVRGGFATQTVRSEAGSEFVTIKALAEVENDIPSANSTVPSMSQQMQHNHSSGQAPNMAQSNWQMDSQEDQQDTSDQLLGSAIGVTVPGSDWLTRNAYNLAGEDATPGWQHGGSWLSRSPFAPSDLSMPVQLNENTVGSNTAGIANDEMNFDLLGSLGILARNRISPSPAALASPASSISRRRQSSSSQFAISSQASNRASEPNNPPPRRDQGNSNTLKTLHEASKTIYEEDFVETRRLPGIIESNAPLSSCPFHKLNSDDDLVQIVRGYPRVMTSPGVYPPFVHHKLYRCAAGDVSEPLARAFCCVGAFYASVPTSKTFVYSLINEQSSKLVKGFVRLRPRTHTPLQCSANSGISINGLAQIPICWQLCMPCASTRYEISYFTKKLLLQGAMSLKTCSHRSWGSSLVAVENRLGRQKCSICTSSRLAIPRTRNNHPSFIADKTAR